MAKAPIDWEAIGREYRAGQLSDMEIAALFGCRRETVTRKAKKMGWSHDLAAAVRKEASNKVTKVTAKVTSRNATEREIVDSAAERVTDVIVLHRQDITKLRLLEVALITELSGKPTKLYMTQYQGKIVQKTVGLTASERAQAAGNLANVQHKRIQLERQAFNLDESGGEDVSTLKIIYDDSAPRATDD